MLNYTGLDPILLPVEEVAGATDCLSLEDILADRLDQFGGQWMSFRLLPSIVIDFNKKYPRILFAVALFSSLQGDRFIAILAYLFPFTTRLWCSIQTGSFII